MSISNTTNTPIGISFAAINPAKSDDNSAGYPLTHEWYNTVTGEKFYHKSDGVWVSYTSVDTDGEVPVMFADLATTAALNPTPIYFNNGGGEGATLTGQSNNPLVVDGDQSIDVGASILVKNESYTGDPGDFDYRPQNGVYILTQQGDGLVPYVLTRADFCDVWDEVYPSQVNILGGNQNINKYFLQKTVDPVIGTDPIIYEEKTVPPTPTVTLPVIHVDTVTTEPLPSCTYENIYAPEIPGQWVNRFPISATLTATSYGELGNINGVTMSNSFLNRNRKILVKNQADARHNGDYVIVQRGSATQPWKLERITKDWASLDKNLREWKANNPDCNFYGSRYCMTSSFFGRMGSTPINFSEVGAGFFEVTYDKLLTLKNTSKLIKGQTYLLTDYMTVYEQPVSGETISSGVIEKLYIVATDVDKLSKTCRSVLHPEDIVYYEITGNIGNGKGTEGFTKGKIYRRIDTLRNNDVGTDWRYVKYRRYKIDVTTQWVNGTYYSQGDIVRNGSSLYICIKEDLNSQSLSDKSKWFNLMYNNSEYVSVEQQGVLVNLANDPFPAFPAGSYYIPIDIASYNDYSMFNAYGNANVDFPKWDVYNNKIYTDYLCNNVFLGDCYNNEINGRFENNTFNVATNNSMQSGATLNYIRYMNGNTIHTFSGDGSYITLVGNMIYYISNSIIFGSFEENLIDNVTNCKFGQYFYRNIIEDLGSCDIGERMQNNIIYGNNFEYNRIGGYFKYNRIGDIFSANIVGDDVSEFSIMDVQNNWTISNALVGDGHSLPSGLTNYTKYLSKSNTSYIVSYTDEFGDTNIIYI